MPLRDDTGPRDDRWTRVEPGEGLAEFSLLDFADAVERGPSLAGIDPARLGLHVANDAQPDGLIGWFEKVALISVDFPSFA
ncbi:MAG: hypothetical protein AAFP78_15540, partial [Pseudomonadota bacterium]